MAKSKQGEGPAEALMKIDAGTREAVIATRGSKAVKALSWYSEIGDQPQMRTIAGGLIVIGLIGRNRRLTRAGVRMLIAHELATTMKNFVKKRVNRTRPRSARDEDEQKPKPGRSTEKEETSFPSGHSAGAVAAARAFAAEYPEHKVPALTAAGLVAVAQIPRCAHYPTDVGAGIAIGAAAEAAVGLAWRAVERIAGLGRGYSVERLNWSDEDLGSIDFPAGKMEVQASFGSGLARRSTDAPGVFWAVGDRGPNLKIKTMVERYGVEAMRAFEDQPGTKVMPRLDLGPQIAQLRVNGNRVERLSILRLKDQVGEAVSGLPIPGGEHARAEPAIDLDGNHLDPDPSGLDTEGIAALSDGGFWVGDEFGPSLVRLDAGGKVLARLVPETAKLDGAGYPIRATLPAIAGKRQLNRGFEAIALSGDEKWLFLAFQSPLAHPDEKTHERASHVRVWRLDAATMEVAAQYLYPLDPPESFRRDRAKGTVERSDLKVSEMVWLAADRLLILERASETTKLYSVELDEAFALPPEHLDIGTRPTVEELSAGGTLSLPVLRKTLLFNSDDAPEVSADLEGMVILSPTELLLVNDNDFGVEGAHSMFWRLRFDHPIFR